MPIYSDSIFHSFYKGWSIYKVVYKGRTTYDIYRPDGDLDSIGHESLRVARAEISAELNNWD